MSGIQKSRDRTKVRGTFPMYLRLLSQKATIYWDESIVLIYWCASCSICHFFNESHFLTFTAAFKPQVFDQTLGKHHLQWCTWNMVRIVSERCVISQCLCYGVANNGHGPNTNYLSINIVYPSGTTKRKKKHKQQAGIGAARVRERDVVQQL